MKGRKPPTEPPDDDGQESFDWEEAGKRKDEGMELAAVNRKWLLRKAVAVAVMIAVRDGKVNIDQVQAHLIKMGYHPWQLGKAAGCIFRGREWEEVGWMQSERISNHRRPIRWWRLKD